VSETQGIEAEERLMITNPNLEDTAIRERIDSMTQAIRAKDVDTLMTHYTPDVVAFDLRPPLEVQGAVAYRKNFERWFASMQGPMDYEMHDLRVSVGDSVAFSFCKSHVQGTRTNGDKADYWVRVTTEFQKVNGEWLVGHEHVSVPAES
jgi:ketosteroid isomerase-like protein